MKTRKRPVVAFGAGGVGKIISNTEAQWSVEARTAEGLKAALSARRRFW